MIEGGERYLVVRLTALATFCIRSPRLRRFAPLTKTRGSIGSSNENGRPCSKAAPH